ncbi:MAG: ribonuclease R, partial [Candidatus Aminicenantes bacterium]|nr:ribonuclease R [Candidatus Aminicenantes bacterium]
EDQGAVYRLKRKYYIKPRTNFTRGIFSAALRGYGFVKPFSGEDDIFIPLRFKHKAITGDVVEVIFKPAGKRGKPEGRIVKVLKKERSNLIGVIQMQDRTPFFVPLDSPEEKTALLSSEEKRSLTEGSIVIVERDSYKVLKILGEQDDPGVDIKAIIEKYYLPCEFSEEILKETEQIPAKCGPEDRRGRKNFRTWTSMTIDGEDARDFDDAVSIKKLGSGNFLLGVHIADVSHYVLEGTYLDKEAFERGTSIYFPDLVLPMLPEKLSDYVCSLRPNEEKLTISVVMEIDPSGNVVNKKLYPSCIRTCERMTYDSVFKIIKRDQKELNKYSHIAADVFLMNDLSTILRNKRRKTGSLDFDLAEPGLIYKDALLDEIVPLERNEAHQIIEEFMVAANEAVATYIADKGYELIYRVHPPPAPEDLNRLRELLAFFGLALPGGRKVRSQDLQKIIDRLEGRPEKKLLLVEILRSLRLAVYSPENQGHFGLAKKCYTHFTSPIRRYPDLVIHRILKQFLYEGKYKTFNLSETADHSTDRERRADKAERDLLEWRIFRFLKKKLGDEVTGIVVGIHRRGIVVELDNYLVEGFVSMEDLTGQYRFKKRDLNLKDKRTGAVIQYGEWGKYILAAVDPFLRRIVLVPSSNHPG